MLTSEQVAELSHDMRVPLASIIGHLEMIEAELGGSPNAGIAGWLAGAMRAAERMERMLDQRMEVDPLGVRTLVEVDLCQVAHQLAVDSVGLLEQAGATLQIGWLPLVHADPDQMYSVLQNLLTNAAKFTRPGAGPRVSISSSPVPYGWRISVTDNGIGIPADHRLDVFTLFTRANPGVEGHGIGLGTVAHTVHDLGGRVGADEAPGGGAEVWFELPASADAATRATVHPDTAAATTHLRTSRSHETPEPPIGFGSRGAMQGPQTAGVPARPNPHLQRLRATSPGRNDLYANELDEKGGPACT